MIRRTRKPEPEPEVRATLSTFPIAQLEVGTRTVNLLESAGFVYLRPLTLLSRKQLQAQIPGLGDKIMAALIAAVGQAGFDVPDAWH